MPTLNKPLVGALLLSAASTACGFAALGVALWAHGPDALKAGGLFAAVGAVTGGVLMVLPMAFNGLPAQARLAAGQADADAVSPLAAMARATLASIQAPRRSGNSDARSANAAPAVPAAAEQPANAQADTDRPRTVDA